MSGNRAQHSGGSSDARSGSGNSSVRDGSHSSGNSSSGAATAPIRLAIAMQANLSFMDKQLEQEYQAYAL